MSVKYKENRRQIRTWIGDTSNFFMYKKKKRSMDIGREGGFSGKMSIQIIKELVIIDLLK